MKSKILGALGWAGSGAGMGGTAGYLTEGDLSSIARGSMIGAGVGLATGAVTPKAIKILSGAGLQRSVEKAMDAERAQQIKKILHTMSKTRAGRKASAVPNVATSHKKMLADAKIAPILDDLAESAKDFKALKKTWTRGGQTRFDTQVGGMFSSPFKQIARAGEAKREVISGAQAAAKQHSASTVGKIPDKYKSRSILRNLSRN